MGKRIGMICVVLGVLCLVGFVVYNRWEAAQAAQVSQAMLEEVQLAIKDKINHPAQKTEGENAPQKHWFAETETLLEMDTVPVNGYACIGILSIPALELELPVLKDWSYGKLKKAPCLYYGSYYESDFVIAAHNYKSPSSN